MTFEKGSRILWPVNVKRDKFALPTVTMMLHRKKNVFSGGRPARLPISIQSCGREEDSLFYGFEIAQEQPITT